MNTYKLRFFSGLSDDGSMGYDGSMSVEAENLEQVVVDFQQHMRAMDCIYGECAIEVSWMHTFGVGNGNTRELFRLYLVTRDHDA